MDITFIGYNFSHNQYYRHLRPDGAKSHVFIHVRCNASFVLDGKVVKAPPNSIIFYKQGTPQDYGSENENVAYSDDWFHFSLTDEEQEKFKIPFNRVMTFEDTSEISRYVEKIQFETHSLSSYRKEKIKAYFDLLCMEILEKLDMMSSDSKHINTLYNVRSHLYNMPHKRLKISHLANMAGLSESHFFSMYKKTFGISPIEDAIRSRIERAKYYLRNSTMNIGAIARDLNYKNDVQFMRQFKKITGLTPSEYRKTKL